MSALLPGGKLQLFIQQTLIEYRLCCWRCSSERASLEAQTVKNLPAMQETRVPSLGGEDPLEEKMTTHYSILAWRIQEHSLPLPFLEIGRKTGIFQSLFH